MNRYIETDSVPIYNWCPDIEAGALDQMKVIARLPFVFNHVCLMPDAHAGMKNGMPIGGVVACKNVVVPNFVGVDIGCGMCAVKSNLTLSEFNEEKRKELLHSFHRGIPVGFSHNPEQRKAHLISLYEGQFKDIARNIILPINNNDSLVYSYPVFGNGDNIVFNAFFDQLGTLGGGNHFIEIQHDEDGWIWIMIHSGSRNMGKKICDYFNDLAIQLNEKWFSNSPIPFLSVNSDEGKAYLEYMNFALKFAYLNRMVMIEAIKKDISYAFKDVEVKFGEVTNIHHNYASLENHFGSNVWVHRKGATLAVSNRFGIIPGSMGTASYIVKGKDHSPSFSSCSHGAGRRMGRKEFNRQHNTPEKMKEINDAMAGITFDGFGKERSFKKNQGHELIDVSESPGAYKDIDMVMANQKDLVDIVTKLMPVIAMKDVGEE